MKYAISVLRMELAAVRQHMKMVAATEFKMECAGQIAELEKAIKALKAVGK